MDTPTPNLTQSYSVVMLALLIWREARGESPATKFQVGWTVRNRKLNPSWWGNDWVEVITKKWQYSSLTDPNDKQLTRYPTSAEMIQYLNIAWDVYTGGYRNSYLYNPFYMEADSYYDNSITPPKWATNDKYLGKIDHLMFYNIDGSTGD